MFLLLQDLYKKHVSFLVCSFFTRPLQKAVPVRLPYAIVTKQVQLTGWKRFEMNQAPSFRGVSEHTFPSILRRSLVAEMKARFLTHQELRRRFPRGGNEEQGIFPRNPETKEMLRSGPAACTF